MYEITLYDLVGRLSEPFRAASVQREEGWLGLCRAGHSDLRFEWYPAHRVFSVLPVA